MKRNVLIAACFLLQISFAKGFCVTTIHYCLNILPPPDEEFILNIFDTIKEASVPTTLDNAIASAVSEVVSGGAGGLASRSVADIIGDKKRDSRFTKISATSAFFGTRGLVRIGARFLGVPRPVAILLASLFGSIASEFAKYLGRGNTEDALNPEFLWDEVISWPEIIGDVSKWIAYDLMKETLKGEMPLWTNKDNDFDQFMNLFILEPYRKNGVIQDASSFFIGGASAAIGKIAQDVSTISGNKEKRIKKITNPPQAKDLFLRYSQAALEGGILFLSYELILKGVQAVVPKNLGRAELVFDQVLEFVEGEFRPPSTTK